MLRLLLLFAGFWALSPNASAAPVEPTDNPTGVARESFNLRVQSLEAATLNLKPAPPSAAHNWFAGELQGLPIGRALTVQVEMSGQDTQFPVQTTKWDGVRPALTYADPALYETYLFYQKNEDGHWISSDVLASPAERDAGTGVLPRQSVLPPVLADAALSPNKTNWSPWQAGAPGFPSEKGKRWTFQHTFAAPRAAIALGVPFTLGFYDEFLKRLEKADLPGVFLDEIGRTAQNRPLRIVRLEPLGATKLEASQRPTVLITAREQATDHDAAWVAFGMLSHLLEETPAARQLRTETTYLFAPILDPDAAAQSRWKGLVDAMILDKQGGRDFTRPEAVAYARYLAQRANQGHSLDLVMALYSLEGRDAQSHITSPYADSWRFDEAEYLNVALFATLRQADLITGPTRPAQSGNVGFRLGGWSAEKLGALQAVYQVNGRFAERALGQSELMRLGAVMARGVFGWLWNEGGEARTYARDFREKRAAKQIQHFATNGLPNEAHTMYYDLLLNGFWAPENAQVLQDAAKPTE